ncbi:tRNA guanosine-2'-O-methyltransferase [Macrolepiota fuliginosa MF-IS2]|uniref:tRNA (guanine(10)-N(2))-methyltransferase n=1 Tax=Macrolepiota fuliginosa MF-IS2 TaxID=1400762 RepID=A0A9P5XC28_9AGAR|nr:tRNA guanosine-2'-O-methyltransferase [Macrolepiota fuliginosa MF-IS2]
MKACYLIAFAQSHSDFRLPELQSISEIHGFQIHLPKDPDTSRPFMVVELDEEEHAFILAQRCILIKSIYEFYARGTTYEEVHEMNRSNRHLWERYVPDTSFKFIVTGFNHTIPQRRQRDVIESFAYMDFRGKIDMKNPEITMVCFEEYESRPAPANGPPRKRCEDDGGFKEVFFGRLIVEGTARQLVGVFDVKKRAYFGNTSMEAEISLLMANQTLASPGKWIYDPFMGTGSMAYPTAHFGAVVFGSDIDGRQMRGKGKPPGVIRAATQYGIASRIIDLCTFDVTNNPWRCGELFDAIVTDPPYGVRAGAKRLGRKRELSEDKKALYLQHSQNPRSDDQPYIPPTKPYELSNLAGDLVLLARYLLRPGGRLVFFLPTVTDEYQEVDIHTMMCEGMEVIANSLQDFGSWGRRLITIRKIATQKFSPPSFQHVEEDAMDTHVPAHRDFREKYFQGFSRGQCNGDQAGTVST